LDATDDGDAGVYAANADAAAMQHAGIEAVFIPALRELRCTRLKLGFALLSHAIGYDSLEGIFID